MGDTQVNHMLPETSSLQIFKVKHCMLLAHLEARALGKEQEKIRSTEKGLDGE